MILNWKYQRERLLQTLLFILKESKRNQNLTPYLIKLEIELIYFMQIINSIKYGITLVKQFIFKMKILKSRHIVSLFLIFLIINAQDKTVPNQTQKEETVNQSREPYKYKVGQMIDVKLIQQKAFIALFIGQISQKYLFLNIQPNKNSVNLPINLYLYKNGQTNPFKKCENKNTDSCYLGSNQLKKDETILLIAECAQKCDFRFRTYWSDVQHLLINTTTKFYFSKLQQKQLYHLELQNYEFTQLRIIMRPETRRNPFDRINIYGKFGSQSEPTSENYDFKSIHLWQDGQGIFLNPNQIKDFNINIFVVGQTQTVYVMTCQLIKQKHHEISLGQILDQYLDPQQGAFYHANFFENQTIKTLNYDQYVLMISGFSGKLAANFFLDADKKHPYQIQPFQYISDVQYIFKMKDLAARKITDGIYIDVKAFQRKSVFTIKFYARGSVSAIKLSQHIYEFLTVEKYENTLAYFQSFYWIGQKQKTLDFSVHTTDVVGKNQISFRICQGQLESCINKTIYQKFSKQLKTKTQISIGSKRTYHLQINSQNLGKLNQVQNQLIILILAKNIHVASTQKLKYGLVALQFMSQNRIQYLREDRPIQTRVKPNQYKVFKFINEDQQVNQIKIYMNQIAGNVIVRKVRTQPKSGQTIGDIEEGSLISITDDLTKYPIFIIVIGVQQAIFSIQLQVIHNKDTSISTFILTEDVEFKVRIKPQSEQVAEIHPIFDDIYFKYKSTGTALACELVDNKKCRKSQFSNFNNQGKIQIKNVEQRVKFIKILNPSFKDTIEVKLIYHSRDISHCQNRQMGKLYLQTIQSAQKQQANSYQGNCWNFQSFKSKDIDIYLSRPDLGELHYAIIICNNLYKGQAQNFEWKITIKKQILQNYCKTENENKADIAIFTGPHKLENQQNKVILPFKIKYLIQYSDEQTVTIPDGVSYTVQKKVSQLSLKTFYYDFINKKDTSITIQQIQGDIYFTVYIVPSATKQTFLNATTYDFVNQQGSFFLNPYLKIKKEDIQKRKCLQCSMIIKVYSKQQINHITKFSIQVSQNFIQLEDHSINSNFLTKNSFAYYSFKYANSKRKGSLIIQIADNNQNCGDIYLSDMQYPDQKAYIAKQTQGNQLIYDTPKQMTYYIGIKAVQDCPYTITVSSTKIPITKLQKGKYSYIQLQKGQIRYFMFHNSFKKQFKLLSVNQYGQLYFYLNRTTPSILQQLMGQDKIQFKLFQLQSQFPNRLVMHDGNKDLCQDCFYIVAVEAKTATRGSIFYGGIQNTITIMTDTKINDYLSMQNQTFKGSFYGTGNIIAQIQVLYGSLKLIVNYNSNTTQKDFQASKELYIYEFEVPMSDETYWNKPASIEFRANKQQTIYSVIFKQKIILPQQVEVNYILQTNIQGGQPNYFQLSAGFTQCLNGFLNQAHQKIFVSSDIDKALTLQNLQVSAKINQKQTNIMKERVRNILSIKFQSPEERLISPASYTICLKLSLNQSTIKLTASQNNNMNILPPDSEVLIQGQSFFIIHPSGPFLLDVLQCKNRAQIIYASSKQALDKAQIQTLEMLGMPSQPHAIKVLHQNTTFLRINSERAYVRWLPMDSQKQIGMGYIKYQIGTIKYSGDILNIIVNWGSIYSDKQTKTIIKSVDYIIILTDTQQRLKDAINCQNYNNSTLITHHYKTTGSDKVNQILSLPLSKSDIVNKYSDKKNLYLNIVANVQLFLPYQKQQNHEHYRFIYAQQELPLQLFKDIHVSADNLWMIFLFVSVSLFFISCCCIICIKKIAPLISLMRSNNMLTEDDVNQQKSANFQQLPAASGRQIQTTNLGTQDQMNQQQQQGQK